MSIILHIARRKAWDEYSAERYYSDPSLTTEGFIHCSTVRQAIDTLNRHFPDERDLVFLCIDEQKLEPKVIYESPKGITIDDARIKEVYPHLYGPINMTAVIRVVDLVPESDGSFQLPEEINQLSDKYR
ncbi:MAG TPA: DUF952 domain-containing protein [Spirochaetia bacterium]|nr:DUF952 domain-containing protein [Spirochaetia bacterium]